MEPTGSGVVFTIGATTGLTVVHVKRDVATLVFKKPIPWIEPGNGAILWNMPWMTEQLGYARALLEPGDFMGGAMPGADAMVAHGPQMLGPVLHYPCIYNNLADDFNPLEAAIAAIGADGGEKGLEGIEKLYRDSGGVNVDQFMLYCQLLAYQRWYPKLLSRLDNLIIAPLGDWFTWWMSSKLGHEIAQMQDYGLLREGMLERTYSEVAPVNYSPICEAVTGLAGIGRCIAPCQIWDARTLIENDGRFYLPVGHDTNFAGLAGRYGRSSNEPTLVCSAGT